MANVMDKTNTFSVEAFSEAMSQLQGLTKSITELEKEGEKELLSLRYNNAEKLSEYKKQLAKAAKQDELNFELELSKDLLRIAKDTGRGKLEEYVGVQRNIKDLEAKQAAEELAKTEELEKKKAEQELALKEAADEATRQRIEQQYNTEIAAIEDSHKVKIDALKDEIKEQEELVRDQYSNEAEFAAKLKAKQEAEEKKKKEREKKQKIKDFEAQLIEEGKIKNQYSKKGKEALAQELIDQGVYGSKEEALAAIEKKHKEDASGKESEPPLSGKLLTALADFSKKLTNSIDKIAESKGLVDTRLQGSTNRSKGGGLLGAFNIGSYWDSISDKLVGLVGASPIVKQESVAEKIKEYIAEGINFDVEQRAFLAVLKDKIATTFDANNSTLRRLIRLQQEDSTAARLGMESAMTAFLNNMYETTEYLSDVALAIRDDLQEAEALMSAGKAAEFEYQVQKWAGSMYSVGMSQKGVESISGAIGKLAAGQIEGITEGGVGNLIVMAANAAGVPIAEALQNGLDDSSTNKLMKAVVEYLAQIYESTKNSRVLQQQYAQVFGLTASDLKAMTNLAITTSKSSNTLAKSTTNIIANQNLNYNGMISQLYDMANSMYERTSTGELLNNTWNNLQYSIAEGIASSPALYGIYKVAEALQSTVDGINVSLPLVMGTGPNTGLNIAQLMQMGTVGGGLLSSVGKMILSGGGGFSGKKMLDALGVNSTNVVTRGTGNGLKSTIGSSVSESGSMVGNTSGSDVQQKTMTDATDKNKQDVAKAQEENSEVTNQTIDSHIMNIYNLLQRVVNGTDTLKVDMGNTMAWTNAIRSGFMPG